MKSALENRGNKHLKNVRAYGTDRSPCPALQHVLCWWARSQRAGRWAALGIPPGPRLIFPAPCWALLREAGRAGWRHIPGLGIVVCSAGEGGEKEGPAQGPTDGITGHEKRPLEGAGLGLTGTHGHTWAPVCLQGPGTQGTSQTGKSHC